MPREINIRNKVLVPLVETNQVLSYPMHASFHYINHFLPSSIHHTSMYIEFKNLFYAINHMNMLI